MDGEWKIQINNFEYKLECQVFIYRLVGDMIQWLSFKENQMIINVEKRSAGSEQVKPAFVGDRNEVMGIAKGFIAYANSQGFKNGDETFAKGKLEATERHLEDMRNIVFKQ